MIDNIPREKIAAVLRETAESATKVAAERDELRVERDMLRNKLAARELADDMRNVGLVDPANFSQLLGELEKKAGSHEFDVLREAVNLHGPQLWNQLAATSSGPGQSGGGLHPFESFILQG